MSQIAWKSPLEKMQIVQGWGQSVAALLVWIRLCSARTWAIWTGTEKAHHGGGLLDGTGDSLRLESSIATALNCVHKAIILQKMHEWIEYNKSKRDMDKRRDGAWWTYNSYSKWRGKHFGWLSTDAIGRHVRDLETMGLIRTGQYTSDSRKKWYTINYSVLTAFKRDPQPYLALLNLDRVSKKTDRAAKNQDRASAHGDDSNVHDDSSGKTKFLPNQTTQEQPTKPGRGGRRAGAGRKAKPQEALIEQPQPLAPHEQAPGEAESVGQSTDTGDSDFVGPSPSSAAPSPHAEPELLRRMTALTLDEGKAAALIDAHGANRVRAVVHRCEQRLRPDSREQRIDRPAGWIIKELENDVFKLGTMTDDDERAQHVPSAGLMGAYKTYDPSQDLKYRRATDDAAVEVFERLFGDGARETPVEIEPWRLEALRIENERFAAEEAAIAAAQSAGDDCEVGV
jgi:hypothetical protein